MNDEDRIDKLLDYENRIAELEALLGKWISHDGHVCPSCGCPTGLQETISKLEAENERLKERLEISIELANTTEKELREQYDKGMERAVDILKSLDANPRLIQAIRAELEKSDD